MVEKKVAYYQLVPVFEVDDDVQGIHLVNASVGTCGLCGGIATGMGGSYDQVCVRCAKAVIKGQVRGAVVWEEEPDANS